MITYLKSTCLVQVQALARWPRVLKNVIMVSVPSKITDPRSSKDISITVLCPRFHMFIRGAHDSLSSHVIIGSHMYIRVCCRENVTLIVPNL